MSFISLTHVGVDVGGTNTDAVLIEENQIVAKCKTETTSDISTGVVQAISTLFIKSGYPKERVQSINIGTTHLVNAFIQGKGMNRVMTLRLAGRSTTALPPGCEWPDKIRQEVLGEECYIVDGGYEYDGKEIAPVNPKQILWAINRAVDQKINAVAVIGVFANVRPDQEILVKKMFNQKCPSMRVMMSHTGGRLGLLTRENLTILEAASSDLFEKISEAFQKALHSLKLPANLYLTYGNGTKSTMSEKGITPLRTFHSGPANSFSGAAFLAQVKDAVTVDIGGTSSDVSLLKNGYPVQESSSFSMTGIGVTCNFDLPRMHSFGLGGGSLIKIENDKILIGPKSLGNLIYQKALSFGGDILTPTDIAVYLERLTLGTISKEQIKQKIAALFPKKDVDALIIEIDHEMHQKLANGIREALASIEEIPATLVLVGGGSSLFDREKLKQFLPQELKSLIIPPCYEVANALGAARSLIGAKFVQVYDYAKIPRYEALKEITEKAKKIAIAKGAAPETIRMTSINETQINYLSGEPYQTTITVVGDEALSPLNSQTSLFEEKEKDSFVNLFPTNEIEPLVSAFTKLTINDMPSNPSIRGIRKLDSISIGDIAWGAGLLGSGGGGSPLLGHQLALHALKQGKKIHLMSLDDLKDNHLVVAFGVVGSPVVVDERPPSFNEGIEAVHEIEKKLGKKIDALVVGEGGGMNCTYPFFIAANLGIPIVDGDWMGRALPGINMVTPNIYGHFQTLSAAISNGRKSTYFEADNFASLENKAREITVEMGGIASMAILPMSGKDAKKVVIKGTVSAAEKMGRAIRESQGEILSKRLQVLNAVLQETDYKEVKLIFQGKIVKLISNSNAMTGFNMGGFVIENPLTQEQLSIGYQNENLIAFKSETEVLAQVPEIITVMDPNNMQPISCGEYRFGQSVVILKLSAPPLLSTPEALAVVGPSAFPLKEMMRILKN